VIDRVGYLKINNFSRRTAQGLTDLNTELDKKLKDMTSQNIKGLVIDLRGVRYGYYVTMNSVLSRFIQGQQLLIIGARNTSGGFSQLEVSSVKGVTPLKLPLAVVVDNTTLAEGEIFALALQGNKAARIFGQPSGGCAVGSETVSLTDKSVLNVAVFRPILDPSVPSSFIEQVLPDEEVVPNLKDLQQGKDSVLEKALAYIKTF
jgi:carboxyl-terminal processing protease